MDLLFILAGAAALIWALVKVIGRSGSNTPPPSEALPAIATTPRQAPQRIPTPSRPNPAMVAFKTNEDWISARWADAIAEQRHEPTATKFPELYFDPITERQVQRLEEDGFLLDLSRLSKGQASDLIGLLMPSRTEDDEVLRFFNCPDHWFNQTRARFEAAKLLSEPTSLTAWKARPSKPCQRDLLKSYGVAVPKDITFEGADARVKTTEKELAKSNPELLHRTQTMNFILGELDDHETRVTYGFKKPPAAVVRLAIHELEEQGQTLDDMSSNIYSVVEKILELRPDLERIG